MSRSSRVVLGISMVLLWSCMVDAASLQISLTQANVRNRLLRATPNSRLLVSDLPWDRGNAPASASLVRRSIFARESVVHVMTDTGEQIVRPHQLPIFVGTVVGDPDSLVILALPAGGVLHIVVTSPHGVREFKRAGQEDSWHTMSSERVESGSGFRCFNDELVQPAEVVPIDDIIAGEEKSAVKVTTYEATVAIETDHEFYQLFNDVTAATDYLGTVIASASAIYERDLSVELGIGDVFLWQTSSDPWDSTDAVSLLTEFGDYWHSNRSGVDRDVAQFFSGKNLGGGVSWLQALCMTDFWCPTCNPQAWVGAYSVCGNIDGTFDPGSTNPWVRWDLICSAHELGHSFSSPHTHCYNDWPNAGDEPVDECYSGESGCFSGATQLPSDGGTIMSYCHLLSGGLANINLYFGLAGHYGVQSERVPQRMRAFVDSIANPPACLAEVVVGPIPGDADGDLDVDGADLQMIAAEIFDLDGTATADRCDVDPPCPEVEADGNGDGTIDAADLAVAIQHA